MGAVKFGWPALSRGVTLVIRSHREGQIMTSHTKAPDDLTGFPRLLANSAWQALLATGVAAIVIGALVLAWPAATLVLVGVLFGIYLLVSGIFQVAGAFAEHIPGSMRALGLVSGALSILLGLICFRGAAESILLLAIWIGFGWLLRGITQTFVAMSSDRLPARGWQVFFGILAVIAGIVLITSPFTSIAALTLVSGIWLVVLGVMEAVHAIQLRIRLRQA